MDFYRVFPWNSKSQKSQHGHPFYIARSKQGQGRFDIPELDGVLYCSRDPVSAVAEFIQFFRGQAISSSHFERPDGLVPVLAHFELSDSKNVVDLDDPHTLVRLNIRPSQVLTRNRQTTRAVSQKIHQKKKEGFLWPSELEASWANASLFESRVRSKLLLDQSIRPLSIDMPELQEAAKILGVFV